MKKYKYKGYEIYKEARNLKDIQGVALAVKASRVSSRFPPTFEISIVVDYEDIKENPEEDIRKLLNAMVDNVKKDIDFGIEKQEKQQQRGRELPQIIDEVVNNINKEEING